MDRVVDKTIDVLSKFGDSLGRRLAPENKYDSYYERAGSNSMFPSAGSAFRRPLDKQKHKKKTYSAKQQDSVYLGGRNYSMDNLAASPSQNSFSNYRQNPMPRDYLDGVDRPPYGTGIGAPLNYGVFSGDYSDPSSSMPYSSNRGSVGYAPDYYIAERRQVELVPAPPPRIIEQRVPYPVPVDRPVPQPYAVEVPRPYPVDRPVPYPVPTPVPVDRPVAVPVPVPVPSPPPPPICVPYPVAVPTPVPCYIPVSIPVPSPPPSPIMFEQSVTHTQRWSTGTPGTPAIGTNPYASYGNAYFVR